MSRHTKGEWFAVSMRVELVDTDRVSQADICVCDPMDFNQGHLRRPESETPANAELIAKAPEMYEYLKLLAKGGDNIAASIISSLD